jgi:hypothetical protein
MSELIIRVADGGEQASVATNAAARLLPPLRTLIADTAYAGIISTFQFTTVAGAIAYARAQQFSAGHRTGNLSRLGQALCQNSPMLCQTLGKRIFIADSTA